MLKLIQRDKRYARQLNDFQNFTFIVNPWEGNLGVRTIIIRELK